MDKIKELEVLIEQLRDRLRNYLDENRSKDEIYAISEQMDKLIVEYYRLKS